MSEFPSIVCHTGHCVRSISGTGSAGRQLLTVAAFGDAHRGVDKYLVRTTSRCILFDVVNSSFDTSLVIYK